MSLYMSDIQSCFEAGKAHGAATFAATLKINNTDSNGRNKRKI